MDKIVVCPKDKGELRVDGNGYRCLACDTKYTIRNSGIVDLEYSTLPDVDGHTPYIWSDVFYFENLLKQILKPGFIVLEVCSGPNVIVPLLLKRLNIPVTYYSVGINEYHLIQQRQGVNYPIISIIGNATDLPIADKSVDLYIGHHAINDIWLTKGMAGVDKSFLEMDRVTKDTGYIIQSDCVLQHDCRVGDPSTKIVGLKRLEEFLIQLNYHLFVENGGEMDWLVASKLNRISIAKPDDYFI